VETEGYTLEGESPEKCPVCEAKKERFKIYVVKYVAFSAILGYLLASQAIHDRRGLSRLLPSTHLIFTLRHETH